MGEKWGIFRGFDVSQLPEGGDFETLQCQPSTPDSSLIPQVGFKAQHFIYFDTAILF
jgi:hypothetical protein